MNIYELREIKKNFSQRKKIASGVSSGENFFRGLVGFCLMIEDYCFKKGGIYSIIGPNGGGKSTLLNMLAFIDNPSQGEILFGGREVDYDNPRSLLSIRRRIGYLLQNAYLLNMTVYDNVAYGLKLRKVSRKEIEQKVYSMLTRLSLLHLAKKNAYQLSGGEAQKVVIARTLVLDTDVLLLDEPTANVDKNNIRAVEEIILSLNKERHTTVLVTTHSQEQAYRLSKDVISVVNGHIKAIAYENIFSGTLKEEKDKLKVLSLGGNIKLKLTQGEKGPVTLAIDPKDIILCKERPESSALNNFYGAINKIENINGSLKVFVDSGVIFCALITHRSFHNLQLNIGKKVWVTFKANSVKVIDNDYV